MLWGNKDYATGNNKPKYANTSNISSASTINGSKANTAKYYGNVLGLSSTESLNTSTAHVSAHAGWVSQKIGTGPIRAINIVNGGTGINAAGFLLVTDSSVLGQGASFNASFTIANSQNTLQSFSSNSTLNTISSITIVNGGSGFSANGSINVRTNGSNTVWPNLTVTLGGRGDRINYETLIAMGSISEDDPRDNVFFAGV
jgi:hypothetical protein